MIDVFKDALPEPPQFLHGGGALRVNASFTANPYHEIARLEAEIALLRLQGKFAERYTGEEGC